VVLNLIVVVALTAVFNAIGVKPADETCAADDDAP